MAFNKLKKQDSLFDQNKKNINKQQDSHNQNIGQQNIHQPHDNYEEVNNQENEMFNEEELQNEYEQQYDGQYEEQVVDQENVVEQFNNFDQQHIDDSKKGKLKEEIRKLNFTIQNLTADNQNKQLKIESLERQINLLNENFKSEVMKKGTEAQSKLDSKIKEFQDKYESELKHAKKYAMKSSAIELIDIISNFELAVNSNVTNPEIANYLKGFQMFASMFKNYLASNSIHEIQVNVNDDFNASIMQAFETQKSPGVAPNKVLKVVKKGYKLHDIVLVPTTVIVSE